ncbi:hypothetical protein [Paenibacillus sp.]|nr:hypothetical protein [Paenibacillus sp.]
MSVEMSGLVNFVNKEGGLKKLNIKPIDPSDIKEEVTKKQMSGTEKVHGR